MIRALLTVGFLAIWISERTSAGDFKIIDVKPAAGATDVDRDPLIQMHTSDKFDPATLQEAAVQLLDARGRPVEKTVRGDLGGVITISVERPLAKREEYTIRVTSEVRDVNGRAISPFTSTFTTAGHQVARSATDGFLFDHEQLDIRDGVCGLALAPGYQLFACSWDGKLVRYDVWSIGSVPQGVVLLDDSERRYTALEVDPASTAEETILWLSHDSQHKLSLGPNDFSSTISRVTIRGEEVGVEDVITGLPTGDHPTSGLMFGPDGRLYISQGAMTMLGDKPELKETPLSAALLVIDINDLPDALPLNVRTDAPGDYDPSIGPLKIYSTGIRQAYDVCWHSNGQLYAGVNMNDTHETTPEQGGIPAINARPAEMMIRIVEGKYYGHPNPARNEWVLLGGNPTEAVDAWEVPEYPVGTMPETAFDPTLLIRNLEDDKGPSANGCVEWTGPGALRGRLLFCFYTATRGIHTYKFSSNGHRVIDHKPLLNKEGDPLRFGAPLDIAYDPRGILYVADFSAPERGDSGKNGGVWRVLPED